ncbi:hypothetical protein MAM1_0029c02279 [Mucor ambiguus]|uniref:Uncharacterized protein n=1 Tax=Mucor ambiguus TaxID=91626 RepID=A0A0C9MIF0_9FUNG|nr:hypothetical protein MAM1_0029c02279 [Mucor ambiguus]
MSSMPNKNIAHKPEASTEIQPAGMVAPSKKAPKKACRGRPPKKSILHKNATAESSGPRIESTPASSNTFAAP